MEIDSFFESLPFVQQLGIELMEVGEGTAEGALKLQKIHSSNPKKMIAHGGVTYSLADTVGGVAVFTLHQVPTPTINMRIDYLHPATEDLFASAKVIRDGGSIAVVQIDLTDVDDTPIAQAMGTYKTGGITKENEWLQEEQFQKLQNSFSDSN